MNVKCVALGGTDLADGRRLRNGQTADADLVANRAKIDAGLLLPLPSNPETAEKNIDDVLAWVDGDPTRAQEALTAELARSRPRSTLVARLEELGDIIEPDEKE